ncbi:TPA: hypothetical protein KOR75_001100 [Clostridioides difficile]|nr:hypothetical protein [Clostridioides difficile]
MKNSKYAIILLFILSLFLCGYTTRGPSMVVQEVMEDYDTGYNSFNTIKLEGKYLTLPCNFKLIEDLGFELKEDEKNMVIPAKSFYTMVYAYNSKGDTLTLDFVNSTDIEKKLYECDIYEITMDVNNDNTTSIDIEINGAKLLSSLSDVQLQLGVPKYVSDKYNNVYTASWGTEKYDRDILLSFIDGIGMIGIHVVVEMPSDVEFYDSYAMDYKRDIDGGDAIKEAEAKIISNRNELETKSHSRIAIFSFMAIITATIAICGVFILVWWNKRTYVYIPEDKMPEESINLDDKLEVPEDSYLEDKYKDYLQ